MSLQRYGGYDVGTRKTGNINLLTGMLHNTLNYSILKLPPPIGRGNILHFPMLI